MRSISDPITRNLNRIRGRKRVLGRVDDFRTLLDGFEVEIYKGKKATMNQFKTIKHKKYILYRLEWGTLDISYYDLQHPSCDTVLQQYHPTSSK